jgi:primosomal protein N' (replication factor Y)
VTDAKPSPVFVEVAVPVPLGRAFTYAVPAELSSSISPGVRVVCDFGRRRLLGVVLAVKGEAPDIAAERLKPVLGVVESEPVVPAELLEFLRELSEYYLAPVGEVLRLALPALARSEKARLGERGLLDGARVNAVGRLIQIAALDGASLGDAAALGVRGQAREILGHLAEHGDTAVGRLAERFGNARAALKKLQALGAVRIRQAEPDPDPFLLPVERDAPPELTEPQRAAVRRITAALEGARSAAFLLDGVTASGKTEVYLRSVDVCLGLGRTALALVPEIALTPQLVARFRARFGDTIAVLHSGLAAAQRHSMWRRLRDGELKVAIGARSALFAPLSNLGLICVDEEHDASFKQEEGVRYHARDMALLRAHRAGAVCVLGSATPSMSSQALVQAEKLERLVLPARARSDSALPEVRVIDLRRTGAGPSGERLLSLPLHRELERVLADGDQAILFLNRRGFAPSLVCDACGHVVQCPNCAVAVTVHRRTRQSVKCHYCDYTAPLPASCPECRTNEFALEGAGTERIEATLRAEFPNARIARLDRDVASGDKSEPILARMRRGELDILVGTQMVTKGHDLPHVTLVGVLNADAVLSMPDFRAAERSFQSLVQVAGRAGRGDKRGLVIVQTRRTDHPAIAFGATHDVAGFTAAELRDRRELGYPPFSRMALVRVDAVDETTARRQAERLAKIARSAAGRDALVTGPAPAPLARLRGRYRYHFSVRAPARHALRRSLLAVMKAEADRRVRVAVDIDPMNML